MKILEFVKRLVPTFSKNEVKNKVRVLVSRIEEYTIDALLAVVTSTGGGDARNSSMYKALVTSPRVVRELNDLYRLIPKKLQKDLTAITVFALRNAVEVLEEGQKTLYSRLPETIHVEGVTYATANILRFIDIVDSVRTYSTKLAYVMAMEVASTEYKMLPADKEYLLSGILAHIEALKLLVTEKSELQNKLFSAKEIMVASSVEAEGGLPTNDTDPLRMSLIPVITPLFGRIGMSIVDWEIKRAEKLQLEKRGILHAIERARLNAEGMPDARAEAIMAGWARELEVVERKLARLEGK